MKGKVLVMVNIKARKLAGLPSEGMLMCSNNADQSKFDLLRPQGEIGERIYLEGYEDLFNISGGDSESMPILKQMNTKRKIVENCLPHLRTNE